MKQLIRNYYYIASAITGSKISSYYIAIFITTVLCVISLFGLSLLMKEMLPIPGINIAFKFPYSIASGVVIYLILMKSYPSNRVAYRNPNKQTNYLLVVLSVLVTISLYSYSWFAQSHDLPVYEQQTNSTKKPHR